MVWYGLLGFVAALGDRRALHGNRGLWQSRCCCSRSTAARVKQSTVTIKNPRRNKSRVLSERGLLSIVFAHLSSLITRTQMTQLLLRLSIVLRRVALTERSVHLKASKVLPRLHEWFFEGTPALKQSIAHWMRLAMPSSAAAGPHSARGSMRNHIPPENAATLLAAHATCSPL